MFVLYFMKTLPARVVHWAGLTNGGEGSWLWKGGPWGARLRGACAIWQRSPCKQIWEQIWAYELWEPPCLEARKRALYFPSHSARAFSEVEARTGLWSSWGLAWYPAPATPGARATWLPENCRETHCSRGRDQGDDPMRPHLKTRWKRLGGRGHRKVTWGPATILQPVGIGFKH